MKPVQISLLCLAFLSLSMAATAQKHTTKAKHPAAKTKAAPKSVVARSAAYFPDYYAFYDSSRHKYVYWKDQRWTESVAQPSFMKTVDGKSLRVQILHDESMMSNPEDRFQQYMKMYPPINTMPGATVPVITVEKR